MSEKRVSNETLGKVIVQVVKNLENNLKASEKAQLQNQEELKKISNNIASELNQEVNRLNSFKVDLSPLDDKLNNYLVQIKKVTEEAQKELKSPILGVKMLGVFFGVIICLMVFFFFFNEQAKDLKKERAAKEHFIDFIKADEKRIEQYNKWAK
ncbi:hypothetical protein HX003_18195 [Myroides odoratimimus]|nr:hypothetical protein [Myroides odoratimimus]